jgi:hypothetical protein
LRLSFGFDSSPLSACATDSCDEALRAWSRTTGTLSGIFPSFVAFPALHP